MKLLDGYGILLFPLVLAFIVGVYVKVLINDFIKTLNGIERRFVIRYFFWTVKRKIKKDEDNISTQEINSKTNIK